MVECRFYTANTAVQFCHEVPNYLSVAQWIRATGFYPVGWGFESLRAGHTMVAIV